MKTPEDNIQESQNSTVQMVSNESSNGGTAEFADNRETTIVQRKLQESISASAAGDENPIQRKNNTGLPDNLKSGIENLSGYSMDDVKVHYNSSKPAQLQAHAYAQGTDIHLGAGQEKHLAHEAWHVVQQKQGRVKPTRQFKSKVNINDDAGLEKEADVMGGMANSLLQQKNIEGQRQNNTTSELKKQSRKFRAFSPPQLTVQCVPILPPLTVATNANLTAAYVQAEASLTGPLNVVNAIYALKNLLKELEFFRHDQSTVANRTNWTALSTVWQTLFQDVYERILNLSNQLTLTGGVNNVLNSDDLINKMEGALQALATRITVANVLEFEGSHLAEEREARRRGQNEFMHVGDRDLPPNMGGATARGLRMRRRGLEAKGRGVCSEFASAAASLLTGKGLRVEILGSTRGKHNFVVIDRLLGSAIGNHTQWGINARVIDLWLGAIWWTNRTNDKTDAENIPFPKIVHDVAEHQTDFKADKNYYDSSAVNPGVGISTGLINARAGLKDKALRVLAPLPTTNPVPVPVPAPAPPLAVANTQASCFGCIPWLW